MRLLFITRKYPPSVGGMEKVSYALIKEFSKTVDTTAITWGGSQKFLPLFLPFALLKSLYLIPTKGITNIHLGDALLSPLGLFLKIIFNKNCSVTVHGLDITYKFPPYQVIVPKAVSKLDKVICVSRATMDECIKRGIPESICTVIPNGVYSEDYRVRASRKDLEKIVGQSLKNIKVLITVGRLVARKGVYWFIKNVVPSLSKNTIYIVVGDGEQKEKIKNLVTSLGLKDKVLLLGRVSDKDLKIIYNTADLMVLPNRKVKGDMEGFGIVAIEASSCGLPVVASNLEGVRDSVIQNKNGYLVAPEKPRAFIANINRNFSLSKNSIHKFTQNIFSWNKISKDYIQQLI